MHCCKLHPERVVNICKAPAMGEQINVYFNICVLPHKKQFERVPCSFDGFPYLNSFHTSALGIPGDCRGKGLIPHPRQSML